MRGWSGLPAVCGFAAVGFGVPGPDRLGLAKFSQTLPSGTLGQLSPKGLKFPCTDARVEFSVHGIFTCWWRSHVGQVGAVEGMCPVRGRSRSVSFLKWATECGWVRVGQLKGPD